MKVHHGLICLFFLSLQDGNTGLFNAQITVYSGTKGEDIRVKCSFSFGGSRMYFCREPCERNILIDTTFFRAQRDRYSIEYRSTLGGADVSVTIRNLTKSDSGRYQCGLTGTFNHQDHQIRIIVVDAASKPDLILPASTTSVSTPTTTTESFSSEQETETTPTDDTWLYVGVTLAVLVVLLSLAVLIYCRKKSAKPNDPPGETEYTSVAELNRVYEDIGEDRRNRSPPVEISSSHTYAKYTTPSGAGARSQDTAEDDSSKLAYSELNFSNRTFGLSRGVIRGDGGDVVYSVPRTQPSSDASRAKDDVYSTVT